jgi:hypothetical protein
MLPRHHHAGPSFSSQLAFETGDVAGTHSFGD